MLGGWVRSGGPVPTVPLPLSLRAAPERLGAKDLDDLDYYDVLRVYVVDDDSADHRPRDVGAGRSGTGVHAHPPGGPSEWTPRSLRLGGPQGQVPPFLDPLSPRPSVGQRDRPRQTVDSTKSEVLSNPAPSLGGFRSGGSRTKVPPKGHHGGGDLNSEVLPSVGPLGRGT